jgi:hypothetical protein
VVVASFSGIAAMVAAEHDGRRCFWQGSSFSKGEILILLLAGFFVQSCVTHVCLM